MAIKEKLKKEKEKYNYLLKQFIRLKNAHLNTNNLSNFHLMCDKFLSPSMSNFVKLQSVLKDSKKKGRRCSDECKGYDLTILFLEPKVYRFLQKV